jgi:hypothetical protein
VFASRPPSARDNLTQNDFPGLPERLLRAPVVLNPLQRREREISMRFSSILLAALMVGATSVSLQPATAAPLTVDRSLANPTATPQQVRYRHHGWHRHGWRHHGWRGGYYGYGPGYYGYGPGYYGPGAVVGGLAAGAIIGSAIAGSQARAPRSDDAYCFRRFKSYDPRSGTYLGYDGNRHPCP